MSANAAAAGGASAHSDATIPEDDQDGAGAVDEAEGEGEEGEGDDLDGEIDEMFNEAEEAANDISAQGTQGAQLMALRTGTSKEEFDAKSVCVKNLDTAVTAQQLLEIFKGCGAVDRLTIPTHPTFGPKGYAYIEFKDADAADTALKLSGTVVMNGKTLTVEKKRILLPTAGGRGGRGRGRGRGRGGRGGFGGRSGGGFRGGGGGFRGRGGGFRGRGRGGRGRGRTGYQRHAPY
jgi:polyadenylate-binding protein 2